MLLIILLLVRSAVATPAAAAIARPAATTRRRAAAAANATNATASNASGTTTLCCMAYEPECLACKAKMSTSDWCAIYSRTSHSVFGRSCREAAWKDETGRLPPTKNEECPPASAACMTAGAHAQCKRAKQRCAGEVLVRQSCPKQFGCVSDKDGGWRSDTTSDGSAMLCDGSVCLRSGLALAVAFFTVVLIMGAACWMMMLNPQQALTEARLTELTSAMTLTQQGVGGAGEGGEGEGARLRPREEVVAVFEVAAQVLGDHEAPLI